MIVRGMSRSGPSPTKTSRGKSLDRPDDRGAHAREFAQAWLDRIPAAHNIALLDADADGGVLVIGTTEARARAAINLEPGSVAEYFNTQYQTVHAERAAEVNFEPWYDDEEFGIVLGDQDSDDAPPARTAPTRSRLSQWFAAQLGPAPPFRSVDALNEFGRRFAKTWLRLIPIKHTLYVSEPEPVHEELYLGIMTIHVIRDDDWQQIHWKEVEVAAAIEQCFREAFPELGPYFSFDGEYCK